MMLLPNKTSALVITFALQVALSAIIAQYIYVPNEYATIQDAIDISKDYDIIILNPRNYSEELIINNKKIAIVSLFKFINDSSIIKNTNLNAIYSFKSALQIINNSNVYIEGISLKDNWSSEIPGGGINCKNSILIIHQSRFENNTSQRIEDGIAGAIYAKSSNVTLNKCCFIGNKTYYFGGAIYCDNSNLNSYNCLFWKNQYLNDMSINGNSSIFLNNSTSNIVNNTFLENKSKNIIPPFSEQIGYEEVLIVSSQGTITNTLFWGDTLNIMENSTVSIDYSNINEYNPLFINNYYLSKDSPCINTGSPGILDLDGTISDIGAFNFSFTPTAYFHFTKNNCSRPILCSFINTTSENGNGDDIINWEWDFGDGNFSDNKEPQHFYQKTGMYNVKLSVSDINDSIASFSSIVDLREPSILSPDTAIDILDTIIIREKKDNYKYLWANLGDTSSYNTIIARKHGIKNFYDKVSFLDYYGCTLNDSTEITVTNKNELNLSPFAKFSVKQITSEDSLYITMFYNESKTNFFNDSIVSITWDFDDGHFSNELNPIHNYIYPDNYNITLTVQDVNDSISKYSKAISIVKNSTSNIKDYNTTAFKIFPNPCSDWLQIEPQTVTNNFKVQLLNLKGSVILDESFVSSALIDVSFLRDGIYFLHVYSAQKETYKPIVIIH